MCVLLDLTAFSICLGIKNVYCIETTLPVRLFIEEYEDIANKNTDLALSSFLYWL
jgi:hypothetical protein